MELAALITRRMPAKIDDTAMSRVSVLRSNRSLVCWLALAASLVGAVVLWSQLDVGMRSPFERLVGIWRGPGEVVSANGAQEKISCIASYFPSKGDVSLSHKLICFSDAYRFDVSSFAIADGENVEGHWEEATRNVTGHFVGRIEDGLFEGSITGPGFAAQMSLRTSGRNELAIITPQDGDVSRVWVVLTRRDD